MRASKIEIVTYAVGGLTLLGGLIAWAIDRARGHVGAAKIAPPMLVFGTGLLVTGGALSIQRSVRGRTQLQVKSLGDNVAFGLRETGQKHTPAGRTRMYYDKKMDVPERVYLLQGLVADAAKNAEMRKLALGIVGHGKTIVQFGTNKFEITGAGCPARDDLCELKAIFDFTANPRVVRYTGDIGPHVVAPGEEPEAIDLFQSAMKTLEFKGGDCLPAGTRLLVEGHRLVAIEDVLPGSKIWGRDRWSEVKNVWYKGELPVDAIQLNNGSWFKATPDHKVYIAVCEAHDGNKDRCACPVSKRVIQRVPVSELTPDMVVVTPERIPFGTEEPDPDRAYIEGLYLADGWRSHDSDFDIAGRDGHPKEAQKREVQAICERLGVNTTWFKKSIRVRNTEWSRRVQLMGSYAWEKHALSINYGEAAAATLLRGIMADSGANTAGNGRTFTSTSYELMLQTRLLHKMFAVTCSERYIEDHGGVGEHPIWRLGVRGVRSDGRREKLLRVKAIERNVGILPVYDISTDDHYVYLPQADVTVSNCDDHDGVVTSLAILNGFAAKFRITSNTGETWDHIYGMAGVPKLNPTRYVALDTTLGPGKFGVEPARSKYVDYAA